ncbi:MAG: SAM-dependent methyltransferase [Clostridia bacterium]|nr:SAM-dependent methyltransferase [Clostridia bacterium]
MQTIRLNMIISRINAAVVADVGTDHAYIPVQLIKNNRAERVIATDMNKGPLSAARHNTEENGVSDKVELRLGDGLSPLGVGECDVIVIAGMGGELISTILSEGDKVAKSAEMLLLQPMNSQELLRGFLIKNGYEIIDEDIEVEGFKVYNLIIARKGDSLPVTDEFLLHLPEYLYSHPKFLKLLAKKKREFEKILSGLTKARDKDYTQIQKYEGFLNRIYKLEGKV